MKIGIKKRFKHCPLPWRIERDKGGIWLIVDNNGIPVVYDAMSVGDDKGKLPLIRQLANQQPAIEELIEEAKIALRVFKSNVGAGIGNAPQLKAALAKLEERP